MALHLSWYLEPRIVHLMADDVPTTLDDVARLNDLMLQHYLSQGTAPVHISMGTAILIREQTRLPLLEYLGKMLVHMTGLHFHIADSWAQAQQLLQESDATLAGVAFPPVPAS
ncbi:MAG: hypothetical protein MUE40_20680 [Anaerolineae bacterium]|nr:hypothetical protein [Anaerolineae bacterium]